MSFSHSAGCWQWLSGSGAWRYRTKAPSRLSLGPKPLNARSLIRPYEWEWLHLNKRVQFGVHLCSGHFTKWASSLQSYPQRYRKLNESQAAQWVSGWIMQLILLLFTVNVRKKLLQKTRLNKSSVHLAFLLNADLETVNRSLRMFSDNMIFFTALVFLLKLDTHWLLFRFVLAECTGPNSARITVSILQHSGYNCLPNNMNSNISNVLGFRLIWNQILEKKKGVGLGWLKS